MKRFKLSPLRTTVTLLALLLSTCAIGLTTRYESLALIVGNLLIASFAFVMFYATLHLQKVR